MKKTSLNEKAISSCTNDTEQRPSTGPDGSSLTPPAYGIQSLDHSPRESTPEPGTSVQRQAAVNRTGLPDALKSGIESLSGLAMDDVRVHYNSSQPANLQALAYAQGTDIHVAPRQERHVPHEAWHVVQQKQGRVRATLQMEGARINDDAGLEKEADVMGERAAGVSTEVQGSAELSHPTSTPNDNTIQMYNFTYGVLNNESGTEIKTDLIKPGDTGGGSNVSVWPSWWPTGPAETANDFLRENFVQGHLLNNKLGGPGDKRYNLTPLTRSTNSQMSASIENVAKKYLQKGKAIKYWVTADYSKHPNVADVGGGHLSVFEQPALQTALNKMPERVGAQITVYSPGGIGGWTKDKKQPKDIYVKNEGAALKGSFV